MDGAAADAAEGEDAGWVGLVERRDEKVIFVGGRRENFHMKREEEILEGKREFTQREILQREREIESKWRGEIFDVTGGD